MHRIKHIHFVGIGGSGMSGIAEVLSNEGYEVSGSDKNSTEITEYLKKLGITVYEGHDAKHVENIDVLVASSAISPDNPEIIAAKEKRIPITERAEMLAELMRFRSGIAIAGTHGKTTTTSLVASILAAADLDPTFVIGGLLNSAGTNARLGSGEYFVAEADESDASFLHLQPILSVVTNIDADHMETYNGDFEVLKATFIEFLHRLPFYGIAVICIDDPVLKEIMPRIARHIVTYGFDESADICAYDFSQKGPQCYFKVRRCGHKNDLTVCLNMPGRHNTLNALAAIAIATELNIDDEHICHALKNFSGVGRRFQQLGDYRLSKGKALFVDDYGHHPSEIEATVKAARACWPGKRLVMLFQPHRYTRTRDLFEDFVRVLSEVDALLLLDIYSAGQDPIPGITSEALCEKIQKAGGLKPIYVADKSQLVAQLDQVLQDGDVLMAQGAGSVSKIVADLLSANKKL